MSHIENEFLIYGCSVAKLNQTTVDNEIFKKFGPVMYASSVMDRAFSLINQGKPEEAKQAINCAKWVLFTFVMGDDE
jgi:hypothetical protein